LGDDDDDDEAMVAAVAAMAASLPTDERRLPMDRRRNDDEEPWRVDDGVREGVEGAGDENESEYVLLGEGRMPRAALSEARCDALKSCCADGVGDDVDDDDAGGCC
jgi:hypothetical protein